MAIFRPKPWVNLCGKMSIFRLVKHLLFYSVERPFFVLEYRKRHFPGLSRRKKKVGKIAIFGPEAWVNPFGKMSILRLFKHLFFYSVERRFFVLEYRKRHFPGLNCQNKKLEKWLCLDQNNGLTPLEKCQFSHFFKFLFL